MELRSFKVDGSAVPADMKGSSTGVSYRRTANLADSNAWCVAPWDSIVLGTQEGDFLKVGCCYLPMTLKGITLLTPTSGIDAHPGVMRFKVDGSKVDKGTSVPSIGGFRKCTTAEGLTYCKTPKLSNLDAYNSAPWESVVSGSLEGDFVNVGGRYLPAYVQGERVLVPLTAISEEKSNDQHILALLSRVQELEKSLQAKSLRMATMEQELKHERVERMMQCSKLQSLEVQLASRLETCEEQLRPQVPLVQPQPIMQELPRAAVLSPQKYVTPSSPQVILTPRLALNESPSQRPLPAPSYPPSAQAPRSPSLQNLPQGYIASPRTTLPVSGQGGRSPSAPVVTYVRASSNPPQSHQIQPASTLPGTMFVTSMVQAS